MFRRGLVAIVATLVMSFGPMALAAGTGPAAPGTPVVTDSAATTDTPASSGAPADPPQADALQGKVVSVTPVCPDGSTAGPSAEACGGAAPTGYTVVLADKSGSETSLTFAVNAVIKAGKGTVAIADLAVGTRLEVKLVQGQVDSALVLARKANGKEKAEDQEKKEAKEQVEAREAEEEIEAQEEIEAEEEEEEAEPAEKAEAKEKAEVKAKAEAVEKAAEAGHKFDVDADSDD